MVRALLALALATGLVAATQQPAIVPQPPLLPSGPDPHIAARGGWFYVMVTRGDRLAIRRTRDLARLTDAPEQIVWRAPATGPNARSIWAPELHHIDGRWYIYYTAAAAGKDDDAHRGVFVLENDAADPLAGTWRDRGRINTRLPGLDGTTFTARGRRWFVYSAYDGPDSVLAIAPMRDPWTLAPGETVIARPDQPWERQGGRQILEGPAFLRGPTGDLFLAYSGSACWSDGYAVGVLRAAADADPLDPRSWHKAPRPILASTPGARIHAPGHNAFFTARDGSDWIVYHANAAAGQGCTARRAPRVAPLRWDATGAPSVALDRHAMPEPPLD
ncbi:glycoside hydrolase family 43 protein [Sphingomonas sp. BK235]|uniref:glycoside hydrolase family 43 protein n=1 Tax=Sphingomonas sp. BK235 TaxID=2512131 RepID=UPI001045FDCE|nr:glycoside hydrolase family 43 protein [Sphingomonas sp. BK235]TCP34578.1 GH43 family beta-xylosidase [Sphingomonas sp. BK235]